VADDKHWLSDAVFGAFLGATSGRTVTVRLRSHRLTVMPWPLPGGAGVLISAVR
jgi:hypothetical protein